MKLFILHSVGENIFQEKHELQGFIESFGIPLFFVELGCISGFFGDISLEDFSKILPVLNGICGKNFFYSALDTQVPEAYILGKNIFNFEYDQKEILKNSLDINQMKQDLESNILLTHSKKEEMSQIILSAVYNMGGFLIKTYFLMTEMVQNKAELAHIINDPHGLLQYKEQALLLDSMAFEKLDLIKTRFDSLNMQLLGYSQVLYGYFKNYVQ